MSWLVISSAAHPPVRARLPEGRCSAGCAPSDRIQVPALPPHGVRLERFREELVVEALVEGFSWRGRPLRVGERWLLRPDDAIRHDGIELRLELECGKTPEGTGDGNRPPAESRAAVGLNPTPDPRDHGRRLLQRWLSTAAPPGATSLTFLNGPDCGRRLLLPDDQPLLVGRGWRAGVRLRDALVSRAHAQLTAHEGTATLLDLDSENGIYVDDRKILHATELVGGELLRLGDTWLAFDAPPSFEQRLPPEPASRAGATEPSPVPPERPRTECAGSTGGSPPLGFSPGCLRRARLVVALELAGAVIAAALGTATLWAFGG